MLYINYTLVMENVLLKKKTLNIYKVLNKKEAEARECKCLTLIFQSHCS